MNMNSWKMWLRVWTGLPRSPPSNSFSSHVRLEKRQTNTYLSQWIRRSIPKQISGLGISISKTQWKIVTTLLSINIHQGSQIARGSRWRPVDPHDQRNGQKGKRRKGLSSHYTAWFKNRRFQHYYVLKNVMNHSACQMPFWALPESSTCHAESLEKLNRYLFMTHLALHASKEGPCNPVP